MPHYTVAGESRNSVARLIEIEQAPHGLYTASLDGRLLCTEREPFLAAARVLLAEGVPADTPIVMRRLGSSVDALRSTVGVAAGLAVREEQGRGPEIVRWKAHSVGVGVPPVQANEKSVAGEPEGETLTSEAAP